MKLVNDVNYILCILCDAIVIIRWAYVRYDLVSFHEALQHEACTCVFAIAVCAYNFLINTY